MADYNPQPIVFHTLKRYAVPFLPDAVPQRRGQTAAQISASANSHSKRMKTVRDRAHPESGQRARRAENSPIQHDELAENDGKRSGCCQTGTVTPRQGAQNTDSGAKRWPAVHRHPPPFAAPGPRR